MLRRNLRSVFAAGAYVFPGGAVDPDDGVAETTADPTGPISAAAGVPNRFRVAAIRESFEEAGVLLARDETTGAPVDLGALAGARESLQRGERSFSEIVRDLGAVLDTAALQPIGRFITPR